MQVDGNHDEQKCPKNLYVPAKLHLQTQSKEHLKENIEIRP